MFLARKTAAMLLLFLPFSLTAAGGGREAQDKLKGIDGSIASSMAGWHVPGMALAVVKDGRVVLVRGYGFRNVENKLPVTGKTVFPIASATKSFTATAIGMLADEGALSLDSPVAQYLEGFRLFSDELTAKATVADLLAHRTGVPGFDLMWLTDRSLSGDKIVARLRLLEPTHALGEVFQYNNLMYIALGKLVEKVGGADFAKIIGKRILEPLGMAGTSSSFADLQDSPDHSLPYVWTGQSCMKIPFYNADALLPAGGINSNAEDLAKWLLFNLDNGVINGRRLISERTIGTLHSVQIEIRKDAAEPFIFDSRYGFGWFLDEHRGFRVVEHHGGVDGFASLVSFIPEKRIGIAVLTNTQTNFLGHSLSREIFDRLLGLEVGDWNALYKERLAPLKSFTNISRGSAAKPHEPGGEKETPPGDICGVYENPVFGRITIARDAGKGFTGLINDMPVGIALEKDRIILMGMWLGGGASAGISRDGDGRVESLSLPLQRGLKAFPFKRMAAVKEIKVPSNDAELFVRIAGNPDGGNMLLSLNGGPGVSSRYMTDLEILSGQSLAVVTFDQRGVGRSSAPALEPACFTFDKYIEDIESIRKSLGLESFHLLGHSWGGILALRYATVHPDRVRSLILIGSGPITHQGLVRYLAKIRARVIELMQAGVIDRKLERHSDIYPAYLSNPRFKPSVELLPDLNEPVQNLTFEAVAGYDLTKDLAGLKKRVLMLWGVDDPVGLDIAEEIKAALPAAEVKLIRIEGCGHFWQEKPEGFINGIREFGLPPSKASSTCVRIKLD